MVLIEIAIKMRTRMLTRTRLNVHVGFRASLVAMVGCDDVRVCVQCAISSYASLSCTLCSLVFEYSPSYTSVLSGQCPVLNINLSATSLVRLSSSLFNFTMPTTILTSLKLHCHSQTYT